GEPIPMRKPPTGEPCAGEPHARFGGRGELSSSRPLSLCRFSRLVALPSLLAIRCEIMAGESDASRPAYNQSRKSMRICVYCASSQQSDPAYREAAAALGTVLAGDGHTIVYGGSSVGSMGALAD